MRTARGGVGPALVGAVLAGVVASPGPGSAGQFADPGEDERLRRHLWFSGADVAQTSYGLWSGYEHAPAGFGAAGLRLRAVAGEGAYSADHPAHPGTHTPVAKRFATVAIGFAHAAPGWRGAVFVGAGVDARSPAHAGLRRADGGTRAGVDLAAELWADLSPHARLSLSAGFGTARQAWTARAFLGYAAGGATIGPELAAAGDPAGHEVRVGAALLGPLPRGFGGRLSSGIATKAGRDTGAYGSLAVWRQF